mmetsp:Transcript_10615/g.22810  ORF Transcript_10615/g.22810 Transcript_10615/m.22810 type:complete len:703 (+) Transcript_10615:83-2191(+)
MQLRQESIPRAKPGTLARIGCNAALCINSILVLLSTSLLMMLVLQHWDRPAKNVTMLSNSAASNQPASSTPTGVPPSALVNMTELVHDVVASLLRNHAVGSSASSSAATLTLLMRRGADIDPQSSMQNTALTKGFLGRLLGTDTHKLRDPMAWIRNATIELEGAGVKLVNDCASMFGVGFVENWRSEKHNICKVQSEAAKGADPQTQLLSFLNDAHGKKMMIMESLNVVYDSKAYSQQVDDLGNPKPSPGALKASCGLNPDAKPWSGGFTQGLGPREVRQALMDNQGPAVAEACGPGAKHVVDHPVLLLHRYDTTNAYHNLEDVVTVFLTLAVLDSPAVRQKGVQVIITDGKPLGFYPEIWQRLSYPYPLRMMRADALPPGTCLRHVIHPPYGGASLFSYTGVGTQSSCRSPLVVGLSHWLRGLFPDITAAQRDFQVSLQTQSGSSRITTRSIIWISRRNYEGVASKHWTGWQRTRMYGNENDIILALQKAVLSWNDGACFRKDRVQGRRLLQEQQQGAAVGASTGSSSTSGIGLSNAERHGRDGAQAVAEVADAGASTTRTISRGRDHHADVAFNGALSKHLQQQRWWRRALQGQCRNNRVVYDFQVMELSDVAFYPDQLQRLTRMSILVAVHGAGLANQIWMKPGAGGVIEIPHNSGGNYHYANMASWLGHRYVSVNSGGDQVNIEGTVNALNQMMDALA